jgi:hypothetical protein
VEVRACGAKTDRAHADRSAGRRRRLPRPVGRRRAEARNGQENGARADHLRDGQPRSRNLPPEAKAARPDAIIATGRSDYPNQVNNVLGFPFIFRGALDVRATAINEEMKIAAAYAIADLARQQVPEEVARPMAGAHKFGAEYIIPAPFDPRLMEIVPSAVAQAAMQTGVAQRPIPTDEYRQSLRARLNPTTSVLTLAYEAARANPKRVVFAEGEEEVVLRAAIQFRDGGYGIPGARRTRGAVTTSCARWASDAGQFRGPQQRQFAAGPQDGRLCSTNGCNAAAICAATSSGWSIATATSSARCC